jgi:crotonobetainyl-CoA:carnitine CoA-transferase CaiB-like acyl-CoA transferase
MSDLPLNGFKVLDLSSVLAGPLTGSFFAELGAEVVKIENIKTGGDVTRQWKLPTEDQNAGHSAYYASANYGKKVILLDLTLDTDRLQVEQWFSEVDIVLSNFQKKTAQKLGLDPYEVVKRYPHLIFTQLSAYTWDDPRPGYDLVMQGESGWISMTGTDSEHLAKLPVAIIDIIASHQMRAATLLALLKKAKTGKGSIVHVSLYQSSISALANQASNYLMAGHVPSPLGTLHPNIAPYGDIFNTKDHQKVLLAIGSDAQFKKLWFSLKMDGDIYINFEHNSQRVGTRLALTRYLQQSIEQLSFDKFSTILDEHNLPYTLIHDIGGVFKFSLAKDMILEETQEGFSAKSVSSIAFKIEDNEA